MLSVVLVLITAPPTAERLGACPGWKPPVLVDELVELVVVELVVVELVEAAAGLGAGFS